MPGILQYARKEAKLVGEHIGSDISHGAYVNILKEYISMKEKNKNPEEKLALLNNKKNKYRISIFGIVNSFFFL